MTSVLELNDEEKDQARLAVARRVIGEPGDIESWDLVILDSDEDEITDDYFHFAGDFRREGLNRLVPQLLDRAGLVYKGSQAWRSNEDESEWKIEIFRKASWFNPKS